MSGNVVDFYHLVFGFFFVAEAHILVNLTFVLIHIGGQQGALPAGNADAGSNVVLAQFLGQVVAHQRAILLGGLAAVVEVDGAAAGFRPGVDAHVALGERVDDREALRLELFPLVIDDLGVGQRDAVFEKFGNFFVGVEVDAVFGDA